MHRFGEHACQIWGGEARGCGSEWPAGPSKRAAGRPIPPTL